jgi:hypothetical protein
MLICGTDPLPLIENLNGRPHRFHSDRINEIATFQDSSGKLVNGIEKVVVMFVYKEPVAEAPPALDKDSDISQRNS